MTADESAHVEVARLLQQSLHYSGFYLIQHQKQAVDIQRYSDRYRRMQGRRTFTDEIVSRTQTPIYRTRPAPYPPLTPPCPVQPNPSPFLFPPELYRHFPVGGSGGSPSSAALRPVHPHIFLSATALQQRMERLTETDAGGRGGEERKDAGGAVKEERNGGQGGGGEGEGDEGKGGKGDEDEDGDGEEEEEREEEDDDDMGGGDYTDRYQEDDDGEGDDVFRDDDEGENYM